MRYITYKLKAVSLADLYKQNKDLFYSVWFTDEDFAKAKIKAGKYTIGTEAVKDSFNKTYQEQQNLLGKNEYIPSATILIGCMIEHYKKTGRRLFSNYYVRCSDVASSGVRVYVGSFDGDGFGVGDITGGLRLSHLGVASARKSKLDSGNLEPFESLIIHGEQYELASFSGKYSDGSRAATLRLKS